MHGGHELDTMTTRLPISTRTQQPPTNLQTPGQLLELTLHIFLAHGQASHHKTCIKPHGDASRTLKTYILCPPRHGYERERH